MSERLKKRRFNEIRTKLDEEKGRLEKLMPDEKFAEGARMPYKMRILFLEFGLEVLEMAAGKKDGFSVNIPHVGKMDVKLTEKIK